MKFLLIISLIPTLSFAGLFSESASDYDKKLAKIGERILRAETKGEAIDWSCEIDGTDFCQKEKLKHYNRSKDEVDISGSDLKKHLEELKQAKTKEVECMGKDNLNYNNAKSEDEIKKLIACLKEIKYEYTMPRTIHYFYLDPKKILNPNGRDIVISDLEGRLFLLAKEKQQEDINGKTEVENEVVTEKDFKKHQQQIKETERKYAKYPPIPSSVNLLSGKHTGKRFRVLIQTDDTQNSEAKGKAYQFTYFNLKDTGFSHSGYGHYLLMCNSGNCLSRGAYWEQEVYTANDSVGTFKTHDVLRIRNFDAIVESTGKKLEGVNGLGQKIVLPVLHIIEVY